ncbi:hypothetical protein T552_01578 [Pneumocystis carinii B80]|uniref:Rab-GAP TBC domain-containing protein n=1 Tax=Pneumocystis carinii (strain B80) TaxID=1408658 RepID=A0A0W4ZKP3_PNEC8|nr:hypothetical protein T552_01578 [Pneumocystis carinii B80]KTW28948.1 hypothetical protein T552_01578 [Pneumocystis carinii B80]
MLRIRQKNGVVKEENTLSKRQLPIKFTETNISETKKKQDKRTIENNIQETQENLNSLVSKLEKENGSYKENPKSVSSRLLKSRPPLQYFRALISMRIKDPIISSFPTNDIIFVDNISDLDFWITLIADYSATAVQMPDFLTKKIREGIPHPLRGLVWQSMSGAQNTHLEKLFETLCHEESPYDRIIKCDIARTFPCVEMFKEGGDGQKKLHLVLRAFSLYDIEVGYCQGLGFIVAPLLMNMFEHQAFCVLVRLMECYDMRTIFTINLSGLHLRLFQFEHFLSLCIPSVAKYFNSIGIYPFMYASQWFLSMFAVTCPLPTLHRIYDVIFGEGALETIIRIAIALIMKNETRILNIDFEENLQFLLSPELWAAYNNNDNELISDAVGLDNIITQNSLAELEQKFNQNNTKNHKNSTKPISNEIQRTDIKFPEKIWDKTEASLPVFLDSSTNRDSFYKCNNTQKSLLESNDTASSIYLELPKFDKATDLSLPVTLCKKLSFKKELASNNLFERDNKELHCQIEDLVMALNSLQKEHAYTKEQLETLTRVSLKYKNIALKLIKIINNSNFSDGETSKLKKSNKENTDEKSHTSVLNGFISSDENGENEIYNKNEVIQELVKQLYDSSIPPNPLSEELLSLQEKLSHEQSKVKDLEKQINLKNLEIMDIKNEICDIYMHRNQASKQNLKNHKANSEIKHKKPIYFR